MATGIEKSIFWQIKFSKLHSINSPYSPNFRYSKLLLFTVGSYIYVRVVYPYG